MAGPIDHDVPLMRQSAIIFDTGEAADARIETAEAEGWLSAAAPNVSQPRYQMGRIGPYRDVLKLNSGFSLQTQYTNVGTETIDRIRTANIHRRILCLMKDVYSQSQDVWFRFGYYHIGEMPTTIAEYVTVGMTFMQAERTFQSLPMAASGDHFYADAAPSVDIGRDYDLATDVPPVVIVDVRELAAAPPADHVLNVVFTDGTTDRTIAVASAGASAVAGTDPLREGLYIADFTDPANYTGGALPSTGTFNVQWSGTGIATIADANRAIDIGLGQYEPIPD